MDLNWLESFLYGLFSGLTDILPVSAEAHRILMLKCFGIQSSTELMKLFAHLGVFGAMYFSCRKQIVRIHRARRLARVPKRRRDIEAGLAIAEMIAGMKKPTVSLVLGGGHSIGIPLAVCTKKSFITPTASMTVHPVRMTGLVVGAPQTFRYFQRIQEQIADFVTSNSRISREDFEHYMMATGEIATDVGTILYGKEAVASGLIDKLGGLNDALSTLHRMIEKQKK